MEIQHEAEIQSLFLQALDGEFDLCDLIVIAGTSDGHRYLFQYLKEMARRGLVEHLPPVILYDPLLSSSAAARRHSQRMFQEFGQHLSVLTGAPVPEYGVASAISLTNTTHAWLRRLDELRRTRRISGGDAFQAIGAGRLMDGNDYSKTLDELVRRLDRVPPQSKKPRLLIISAVELFHDKLHELLESHSALVVAEDDAWGARRGATDIEVAGDLTEALFSWYYSNTFSPRTPTAERERWVTERLAGGSLEGVVFYVPPGDQHFGWSYPDLVRTATSHGLSALLLRQDVLDTGNATQLDSTVSEFVARLTRESAVSSSTPSTSSNPRAH